MRRGGILRLAAAAAPVFLGLVAPSPAAASLPAPQAITGVPAHSELLPLPEPDLSEVEPNLARQIQGVHDLAAELLRRGSDREQLTAAFGALGHLYVYYEIPEAAEVCYENGRRLAPGDFRWPYYLGFLYGDLGRHAEAVERLVEAHRLAPRDVPTLIRLGNLELDLGDPEAAGEHFQRALDLASDLASGWWGLGRVAARRGDHEEAIRAFEKALELQPEATLVYYALAQSYRVVGELDKARESLGKYGQGRVSFPDPLVQRIGETSALSSLDLVRSLATQREAFPDLKFLSYCLAFLADTAGAEEHLARELANWPPDRRQQDRLQRARLYYVLGGLLVHKGREAEAMEHFRSALELEPDLNDARTKLANGLAREQNFAAAAEAFSEVLAREPDNRAARLKRAASLMALDRWEPAAEDLRRLAAEDASNPEVVYRLAICLEELGRPEEALEHYRTAGRLDPNPGRAARARLQAANLLLSRGADEQAIAELEQVVQLVPDLLDARLTLAGLRIRTGDFQAALEQFNLAVASHPQATPPHIGRATVLLLEGRYRQAVEALEQSLIALPGDPGLTLLLVRTVGAAPDPAVHDGRRALELAQRLEADYPSFRSAEAMAFSQARLGDFEAAVSWQHKAVERVRRAGGERLARELEARLADYEAGRPWSARNPDELVVLPNER